jgi:cobalt-zinc-cadmium efflux system membrane fusion protein
MNQILFWRRSPLVLGAAAAALVACLAGLSACARTSESAPAPPPPAAASSTADAPSVDLSPTQVATIQVAPAAMYSFPVVRTELGSVAFAEDPAIVQAESTLLGAAATLQLTRKELQRARLLYGAQGVSGREVEQATSDEQTAAAALAAARVALHALGKSDAQIDRMIATGHIDAAPAAQAATQWVEANVFESDIGLVHAGESVRVAVAAYPGRTFTGRVHSIYATVDPNLHRQTVRCEVVDRMHELRPGMLATVTIELRSPLDALAIPADGVVREGDGTLTAWVTSDRRRFTQRIIKTGLREDGQVQILHGLQPNELVVARGAIYLDNMINAAPSD